MIETKYESEIILTKYILYLALTASYWMSFVRIWMNIMWTSLQRRYPSVKASKLRDCFSILVQLTTKDHFKTLYWWYLLRGIHRSSLDPPQKRPVMKKVSPCRLHVIWCLLISSYDSRADWLPIDSGLQGNVLEYITSTGHSTLKYHRPWANRAHEWY